MFYENNNNTIAMLINEVRLKVIVNVPYNFIVGRFSIDPL